MAKHPDCAWQWPPWPPFDAEARCPKCGCDTVTTAHYPEDHYGPLVWRIRDVEPLATPMPERLRRECARCGHWWCESVEGAVNDQAPTGPGDPLGSMRSTIRALAEQA
jgi:ribosomal protein S27AE